MPVKRLPSYPATRNGCESGFIGGDFLIVEQFLEVGIARMAVGASFLIMPFGEFDEWRFLSQINDSEVVVGTGVVGFELDGFAKSSFGCAAHAFLAESDAEVILNLGVLRIEFGGAA